MRVLILIMKLTLLHLNDNCDYENQLFVTLYDYRLYINQLVYLKLLNIFGS